MAGHRVRTSILVHGVSIDHRRRRRSAGHGKSVCRSQRKRHQCPKHGDHAEDNAPVLAEAVSHSKRLPLSTKAVNVSRRPVRLRYTPPNETRNSPMQVSIQQGINAARRCGVKFGRRLTYWQACRTSSCSLPVTLSPMLSTRSHDRETSQHSRLPSRKARQACFARPQ